MEEPTLSYQEEEMLFRDNVTTFISKQRVLNKAQEEFDNKTTELCQTLAKEVVELRTQLFLTRKKLNRVLIYQIIFAGLLLWSVLSWLILNTLATKKWWIYLGAQRVEHMTSFLNWEMIRVGLKHMNVNIRTESTYPKKYSQDTILRTNGY